METQHTRLGLNGLNFFLAAVQTGFGPFVSIYLTQQHWTQTAIGLVLSIGAGAAIVAQLPAGALVDSLHNKRLVTAAALAAIAVSALMLAGPSDWSMIRNAQILHAIASVVLTPAIAALTLSVCGHDAFGERLGINARYASLGNATAAVLMGAFASYVSEGSVFLLSAALVLPALVAAFSIRTEDRVSGPEEHPATLRPRERREQERRFWHTVLEPGLFIFAACVALFQLANTAMLPLALNELAIHNSMTGLAVTASILLPQAIVAAGSPWVGRLAQRVGRRPVLLAGFIAVPLRGLLLSLLFLDTPGAPTIVALQALDGIAGMVFGLMLPLIAADLTQRSGFLNMTIGWFGLTGGIGATFSTTLAGLLADRAGVPVAFAGLALAGGVAVLLLACAMPETRPARAEREAAKAAV